MITSKPKKKILPKLPPGQEVFSTFDVIRIIDIERERLREWMKRKFIPAGIKVSWRGRKKVIWGKNDLYSILLFKLLVESGWPRVVAAQDVDRVDWDQVRINKEKHLIVAHNSSTGERMMIYPSTDRSLIGIKDFETATYINLEKITEDIDSRV